MKIPVVLVDDNEVDRYVVRRVLSKFEEFDELKESKSGVEFLKEFFNGDEGAHLDDQPLCILMDINMPGLSGFETIAQMEKLAVKGHGPGGIVVMMITSSANPSDRTQAEALDSVQGYSTKPLDKEGAKKIITIYNDFLQDAGHKPKSWPG